MVKWRILILIAICFVVVSSLSSKGGKSRLRAQLHYFVRALTVALVLYWLLFILAPLF